MKIYQCSHHLIHKPATQHICNFRCNWGQREFSHIHQQDEVKPRERGSDMQHYVAYYSVFACINMDTCF